MTIDEVVYKVKHQSPIPLGSDWVEDHLRPALQALLRDETERCKWLAQTYGEPCSSDRVTGILIGDKILRTAPGGETMEQRIGSLSETDETLRAAVDEHDELLRKLADTDGARDGETAET